MLIGNFKNDQLNGHCIVFLNNQTYVIGSFVRGLLDGQFILRSDQFTVYWIVKMNKVCGEIVVINYESMKARVWLIESNFFSFIIKMDKEPVSSKSISHKTQNNPTFCHNSPLLSGQLEPVFNLLLTIFPHLFPLSHLL